MLDIDNRRISKYTRICSTHFLENMIDRTSKNCVGLREMAVPLVCIIVGYHYTLK